MLLVKTRIALSKINGIGLFTLINIKKGQVVWRYKQIFDRTFAVGDVTNLPLLTKNFVEKYAYLSIKSGKYILCGDDARFINHSAKPNTLMINDTRETEQVWVAERDIKKGEEITMDYRTFDRGCANSDKGYLKGE